MEYSGYSLGGGGLPMIVKNQINETFADAGIICLEVADGTGGVAISSATAMANAVGLTVDSATYVTAQQTDGTSAEREVGIIIDPHACFRALMTGGATEGTALTLATVTTDTTDGLDVTTANFAWNSPDIDEGAVWAFDGVNVGQVRKMTTTSSTVATPTVAFDNNHVVGDRFLGCPWWPLDATASQLNTTTLLYQARADVAGGTGGAIFCISLELNDIGNDGTTNSFINFMLADHTLSQTT